MGHLSGNDRTQVKLISLEDLVPKESMVRIIDKFVETVDLEKLGFTNTTPAELGRDSYPPKELAKLYLYGYNNGIRSSRKLETEAHRNVELMWLISELKPDHKTIARFRRDNAQAFKKLFYEFVRMCDEWGLVGKKLIAFDGTKIKASNSKKLNFNAKNLDKKIARLDDHINEYMEDLEKNDEKDPDKMKNKIELLKKMKKRKTKYIGYLEKIKTGEVTEISEADPDARLMGKNGKGLNVGYNVQSAVDSKNDLIVEMNVTSNPADHGQLGEMAKKVKKTLEVEGFTALADKGFYNGEDLKECRENNVTAIVAKQNPSYPKEQQEQFHTENFKHDKEDDTYICFHGAKLYPQVKENGKRIDYSNKEACKNCPDREKCTKGKYRRISKNEYADEYREVDERTRNNKELYKRRQAIVEHPFGTIKHTLNGSYFLVRGKEKVEGEAALLFHTYNFKRVIKILGFKKIMEMMDSVFSYFYFKMLEFGRNFMKSTKFKQNLINLNGGRKILWD